MASTDAALPKWVILERFVFRRDDPKSFREDERTSATSTTCTGASFSVSFILAEPPTPSRLYLSWPEGPKDEMRCHLVGAHRNLVLLRLDTPVDESVPFGEILHEYFIYIVGPQVTPLLRPLPQCTLDTDYLGKPYTRAFPTPAVGLMCHGKDEFVVAHLDVRCTPKFEAELSLLRSSSSLAHPVDGSEKWETKVLRIPCKNDDECTDLRNWLTNEVVSFKNFMCWVDYSHGILLCDGICGDSPKVYYVRLPKDSFLRDHIRVACKDLYRSLCVTDHGRRLVFVDITRHDGKGFGNMAPGTGFSVTLRTLKITHNDSTVQWEWVDDAVVTSDQLWDANSHACLPHEVMMIPLLSLDMPDVMHVVLFVWPVCSMSLVAIHLTDKRVQGSVVRYIKSKDDLSTADTDLIKTKMLYFGHFLPSEFPKFLNLRIKKTTVVTASVMLCFLSLLDSAYQTTIKWFCSVSNMGPYEVGSACKQDLTGRGRVIHEKYATVSANIVTCVSHPLVQLVDEIVLDSAGFIYFVERLWSV